MKPTTFWLLKTEPETYSYSDLQRDKKTNWDLVRNYQARNYLRQIAKDDLAIIYHSGDEKAAVGSAQIIKEAYPDIDPEDEKGEWVQVDIKPIEKFSLPVRLSTIKSTAALKDMPLIRNTRLSVMPITEAHFNLLKKLGGIA